MKLSREFYGRDTITVAKELLGKTLVRKDGDKEYRGVIVETEAYLGINDKACHTYAGKMTEKTKTMYLKEGISYVYLIYGIYSCFNITTVGENIPEAVLIRAVEATSTLDIISQNRYDLDYNQLNKYQRKNISNGPGKLCKAFNIDKSLNGEDLLGSLIYVEDQAYEDFKIVEDVRIGIDYAEEAKDYLYRFYIEGNPHVSKLKK